MLALSLLRFYHVNTMSEKIITYNVTVDGQKRVWRHKGHFHREDGPAIENLEKGSWTWVCNGIIHRSGGLPAMRCAAGNLYWYVNGELHREDGPAVVRYNGDEIWYNKGKLHRENGPAFKSADGNITKWYKNGILHCEDGPAVIDSNSGSIFWYRDGCLHRDDGPACYRNGREEWYRHGKRVTVSLSLKPTNITGNTDDVTVDVFIDGVKYEAVLK